MSSQCRDECPTGFTGWNCDECDAGLHPVWSRPSNSNSNDNEEEEETRGNNDICEHAHPVCTDEGLSFDMDPTGS